MTFIVPYRSGSDYNSRKNDVRSVTEAVGPKQNASILCCASVPCPGAVVARRLIVAPDSEQIAPVREDGFGVRRVIADPRLGLIERLELAQPLASWACEQAIRARAAYLGSVFESEFGRVLRIERTGEALAVASAIPDGIPLSDVLAALE